MEANQQGGLVKKQSKHDFAAPSVVSPTMSCELPASVNECTFCQYFHTRKYIFVQKRGGSALGLDVRAHEIRLESE